ncbi:MAG: bifunctional 3,4-dihydroxy-2-butanone-4-phosphate synthase/GTP cyclohydrolase II [Planctomycetia bacterium]
MQEYSADRPFCTIPEAMEELRAGRMIVMVDDEFRENEGDLVFAGEKVAPELVNFMIRHARGLVCLALSGQDTDRLGLDPQTRRNTAALGTAFTVTVDARVGVTSGISASERARTIAVCMDEKSGPEDLAKPGHILPLRAEDGGVLVRAGHTEASVDLCRLAGLKPGAVICEILRDDGEMARVPDLVGFCRQWGLKMCTIEDLIKYRRGRERLIHRELDVRLPTRFGDARLFAYSSVVDAEPHLALTFGGVGVEVDGVVPEQTGPVLVRVHSECLTGDVFGSLLCDCGPQLSDAMAQVGAAGRGVVLYMRQEGRGIGLLNKLRAYKLQTEEGLDTVEANRRLGFAPDLRHYGIGAQILLDLGIRDIRLMTNNPKKVVGLDGYGLRIVERIPIETKPHEHNERYLGTKRDQMGHLFSSALDAADRPRDGET